MSDLNQTSNIVLVKTNQYAIGLPGQHRLYTQFVNTCTALAGVDPKTGVTFLCHLNTCASVSTLPNLVAELRSHVDDVSRFHLYTVGGIHPRWYWAASLVLAPLGWVMFEKSGLYSGVLAATAGALLLPCFFGMTRRSIRRELKKLDVFANSPVTLGFSCAAAGLGKRDITIDESSREGGPRVRSYWRDPTDQNFEVTPARRFSRAWWTFNWVGMTRADGSALLRKSPCAAALTAPAQSRASDPGDSAA
ncbi:hypothetical protein [Paraburkholderia sp. J8-2]|uniref:hypothetical protein n=1 Tax=Paraburkholderia sp. J8-2 TaxID=2805440 RepID=UPI002AB67E68|nr:hypothetical protein [Paraburkholderia sp. J8-2]